MRAKSSMFLVGTLFACLLSACGSSSSAAGPTATTVPVTPASGNAAITPAVSPTVASLATPRNSGPGNAIGGLSIALIRGDQKAARSFLTPSLAATQSAANVASMLGLKVRPRSYTFSVVSHAIATVVERVTYRTLGGPITDSLTLVRRANGWRVQQVKRGSS